MIIKNDLINKKELRHNIIDIYLNQDSEQKEHQALITMQRSKVIIL